MDSKAAVERALKLLRLAAPTGDTAQDTFRIHERQSAALEAAKIISEHHLTVTSSGEATKDNVTAPTPNMVKEEIARAYAAGYAAAGFTADAGFYASTKPKRGKKAPRAQSPSGAYWREVTTDCYSLCVACGGSIFTGDRAWFDSHSGFRHYDIECKDVF